MAALLAGNKRWVIPFTFVCLVLGGMLGVQVHTQQLRGATVVGRRDERTGRHADAERGAGRAAAG